MAPKQTVGAADSAPHYSTAEGCAKRYDVSTAHWRRLVDSGRAPQPVRFGRLPRWANRVLDEWDAAGNPPVRSFRGVSR